MDVAGLTGLAGLAGARRTGGRCRGLPGPLDWHTTWSTPRRGQLCQTDRVNTKVQIAAVHRDTDHRFSKEPVAQIKLEKGLGVAGDAHRGVSVQHLSRVRADPTAPNLRQVHLIQQELFEWLEPRGFTVAPGQLGENVTTQGIDLLSLPRGTLLHLGETAIVEVTGLRNPCAQIDNFQPGLLKELVGYDDAGTLVRRAGVMGVVHTGGVIRPGEPVVVVLPEEPHEALERV